MWKHLLQIVDVVVNQSNVNRYTLLFEMKGHKTDQTKLTNIWLTWKLVWVDIKFTRWVVSKWMLVYKLSRTICIWYSVVVLCSKLLCKISNLVATTEEVPHCRRSTFMCSRIHVNQIHLTVVSSEEIFKLALFLSIVLLWVWVTMKQRLIIVSEKMNMDAGGVKKEKP